MNNNYLREWDRKVTDYLAGLFGFKPHEHQVYDARDPENAEILRIMKANGDSTDWKQTTAASTVMDMEESRRMKYHLVMAAENENHYPLLLADGVTSGEHIVKHMNLDNPDEYLSRFHIPFVSMISHLGARSAYRHLKGEESDIIPGLDLTSEQRMLASFGCLAAYQLISGRKNIPYREIFSAENHRDGWAIVKVEPIIMVPDNIPPHLDQVLDDTLREMGMTPMDLELHVLNTTQKRPRRWKYRPSDN
jgi:hypothetical protein